MSCRFLPLILLVLMPFAGYANDNAAPTVLEKKIQTIAKQSYLHDQVLRDVVADMGRIGFILDYMKDNDSPCRQVLEEASVAWQEHVAKLQAASREQEIEQYKAKIVELEAQLKALKDKDDDKDGKD